MIKGKDVIVKLDGKAIAASLDCTLDVDGEYIPISDPLSASAKKYMFVTYGWRGSIQCLCRTMSDAQAFYSYATNGTLLSIEFTEKTSGLRKTGYAFVQNAHDEAPFNRLYAITVSFLGNGPLDIVPYISNWSVWKENYNLAFSSTGSVSFEALSPLLEGAIHAIDMEIFGTKNMVVSNLNLGQDLLLCKKSLSDYDIVKESMNPLLLESNKIKRFSESDNTISISRGKYCMFVNVRKLFKTHPTITFE